MQFMEWNLPDTHDLIFGQPWFTKYNPRIDWRTQQIEVEAHMKFEYVDGPTFQEKMNCEAYEEIYQLKITHRTIRNIARDKTSSGRVKGRISRTTSE